ncbi:MAG: prepilin-type N-terminal cleavage/methylation domain-containing protein [Bacilli bacterium]|nr:prepilin-type N-terminal cleavage/methylation domain-containing protein [Bacilli bacterium]MDD4795885.1 prepilin-type N-terminal cleavage/methylation domain-containing protein [Bacilli bacterium]
MNKGFTMVELLTVIILLAGIMIIAIPSYLGVAENIKEKSLENKADVITQSTLKFAKLHLIDDIKPASNTCTLEKNCCKYYDLYNFVLEYGLYTSEDEDDEGLVVINPVTDTKLSGVVRIYYDKEILDLKGEFIQDKIINQPYKDCEA